VAGTLTYTNQQVSYGTELTAMVPGLAGALALELPIGSWFAVRVVWDAGAELVPIDGSLKVRPALRGALGIGVQR
jgi:hypothetical protein